MTRQGLSQKILSGSFWTLFSNLSVNLITFSVTVLLARLLKPEDFGIVSISAVFTGIIILFQDLGMGSAIIQRKEVDDDYLSTSFTVSLLTGAVLAALMVAASSIIASFYSSDVLEKILVVSASGFVLSPLTSIHTSILTKRLEFKRLARLNILNNLISGGISIGLALWGYGVWSLVLGRILSQPVMVPITWHMVSWRPRLVIVKKCFRDLFGFSSGILGFNLLNHMNRNFDNLVIGKLLGAQTLGFYSVAYNLMLKPLQLVSWSIGKVLFPVFSTLQDDTEKTREIYLKTIRTISLVTFPMMSGLMIVAHEFMVTFYGSQWEPAVMPLKLLCFVGAVQSVSTTSGVILNAKGRSDISFKIGLGSTVFFLAAFVAGATYGGLTGLILAYILVTLPVAFAGQYYANRLVGMRMPEVLRALLPAGLSSIAVIAGVMAVKSMVRDSIGMDLTAAFVTFTLTGVVIYVLMITRVFRVPEAAEALALLRRR